MNQVLAKRINPETVWSIPESYQNIYAHAVEVRPNQRTLYISAQMGTDLEGVTRADDFEGQFDIAIDNCEALLAAAGMSPADIIKATYYVTDAAHLDALGAGRRRRWGDGLAPSITTLIVPALPRPECLIYVEVIAAADAPKLANA